MLHTSLTRDVIPLGQSADADIATTWQGVSVSGASVYKVNGNYWSVTFASALGDVSGMTPAATKYLTAGTTLSNYDDVVRGDHPTSHVLTDLKTGIDYNVRSWLLQPVWLA